MDSAVLLRFVVHAERFWSPASFRDGVQLPRLAYLVRVKGHLDKSYPRTQRFPFCNR